MSGPAISDAAALAREPGRVLRPGARARRPLLGEPAVQLVLAGVEAPPAVAPASAPTQVAGELGRGAQARARAASRAELARVVPAPLPPVPPPPRLPRLLPVLSPPVPIDDLSAPIDRFRCQPYNALITAAACLDRQKAARSEKRDGMYKVAHLCTLCRDCEDGRRVGERLVPSGAAGASGGTR